MKLQNMINDYEIIINYFIDNNFEMNQYNNFKFYAFYIKLIFKTKNKYDIRKIFFILVELGYFKKIDKPRTYKYKFFNPYKRINQKFLECNFD